MHTPLYCETCRQPLAVLPGVWKITRRLRGSDRARLGHGALKCGRCEARYEVVQSESVVA